LKHIKLQVKLQKNHLIVNGEHVRCNKCGGLTTLTDPSYIIGFSIIGDIKCIDCKEVFSNWTIYYTINMVFNCIKECLYKTPDGNGSDDLLKLFCPAWQSLYGKE